MLSGRLNVVDLIFAIRYNRQALGKAYTKDYKTVRKVTPLVHWRSKKSLVREGLRMSRTDQGRGWRRSDK